MDIPENSAAFTHIGVEKNDLGCSHFLIGSISGLQLQIRRKN